MFGGRSDGDDDGDEWRFSVDEVGEDNGNDGDATEESDGERGWGATARTDEVGQMDAEADEDEEGGGDEERGGEEGGGNVAGSLAPEMTVEPETPELENVAFVAVGALLTILAFASLAVPLDAVSVAVAIGAVAAVAGLLYLVFRRY